MSPILRPQIRLILDSRQVPANRYLSTCIVHSIYTPFKTTLLILKTSSLDFTLHCGLDFNLQLQPSRCQKVWLQDAQGFLHQLTQKSPPSSTTPEPGNPGPSTRDTPIPGPSRLLEPLAPLSTIKDETLSSTCSISPISEQALQSPAYIDLRDYNFNLLEMDRDVKFALLDSPNRPPPQNWPFEVVTKQERTEKRSLGP